ncbi:hypothetical protein THAOC_12209 [Thalassiosira oceanica]|uniref:Uncharacterized protein n=1 Tax=Thalassiosira oceanica TaxID=159749 RepID=K0SN84_THAOC|nr:hypothetical protein THAOC_12209 [Thalassiosira oceanica]|eukprot:EJK66830.1 hypothetical protein THAOC_12209 [Thalassiosira oceanica]
MLRRLRGAHAASSLNGEDKNKLESNYRRRLPSNTAEYLYGRGVTTGDACHRIQLNIFMLAMECNITAALLRLDIAGSKMREAQAKRELDSAQSASEQELDAVERVEWIRRLQILEEERNATRSGFQATLVSNFDLGALRA